MSYMQDLYTFCIYCQLRMCIQFPSCRAMHYSACEEHGYHIKNWHKTKPLSVHEKPHIVCCLKHCTRE